MITVEARYAGGDRQEILTGRHRIVADQPAPAGGTDAGPTPTELFVASVAGCAEFYVQRFLRRHITSLDGLAVRAIAEMSHERPARVTRIAIEVDLPPGLAAEVRLGALRAADQCVVRETLRHAPLVELAVSHGSEVVQSGA